MQLAEAFRKAIESVGLEKVNCKCFWNIVKDLHIVTSAHSFLWTNLVQQEFIMNFLKLRDFNEEINSYISKICFNTGFDLDSVKSLLFALHEGILCSYYGIKPNKDSLQILWNIYTNNKTRWYERIEEFRDGIIIACKDRYFGVLSVRKEILPFRYRGATRFSNGLACFNDGTNFGFINMMGNLEIDLEYLGSEINLRAVGHFSHGIAKIYGWNNNVGFISLSGKHTDTIFDDYKSMSADYYFDKKSTNLYIISKDNKIGLMNNNCEIIVAPQFIAISDYDPVNKSFLAKNEDQEWFLIKEDGQILKSQLNNPSIVAPGIIQDIKIRRKEVKFDLYNISLQKIVNFSINNVVISEESPILIRSNEGIYYFITACGIVFNPNGYEMAFPFVSDFTWVKVGVEWRRLNRYGNVVAFMNDGEIITKEINGKVLRRNKNTSLIEIYNCHENATEGSIPNSSYTVLSEIHGRISALNTYQFQINDNFYVWSEGSLIESMNPILRCIYSKRKIFISNIDNISFKLICDGKSLGILNKRNSDDIFISIYSMDNGDEIAYYKTKAGTWYLYNLNTKKYSQLLSSIEINSVKDRTAKAIVAKNINGNYILMDSNFEIVAEYEKIMTTPSKEYFRILKNSKYGLITFSGKTVIEAIYDTLNYYTNNN